MKKLSIALSAIVLFCLPNVVLHAQQPDAKKPNVVVIVVDQWRAQATGYSGDENVISPNIDQLAANSINLKNAVSGMPVCTPFRGSLMTGQYPLTHGLFMNDVMLDTSRTTLAEVYAQHGYNTGFIGKWHIDGHGRDTFIPENRRHGFKYWKGLECTHNYNHSAYYAGASKEKAYWDGYDALAQTEDAQGYITEHARQANPFVLLVSMGPPHNPYQTAPEEYKKLYENRAIKINENVPVDLHEKVEKDLKGYYAHITAIDHGIGQIWQTIKNAGIEENTIIVFTADHGDLLGAHGFWYKQQPYEESIRVPFLIHYPAAFGKQGKTSPALINSWDIMPTLLGLSGIKIPKSVEGFDFSEVLSGNRKNKIDHTLITCVQPFGSWQRKRGGKEFRGVVTERYTYARDLEGPWLLFDNMNDPFQMNNLVGNADYAKIEKNLEKKLQKTLKKKGDEFRPGMEYVKEWNYYVDESETVPYREINFEGKPIPE